MNRYALLFVLPLVGGCALTPEPMNQAEIASFALDKRSRVTADQKRPDGPITLQDALERALKYNVDKDVEVMNVLLAEQQLRVAHYSKLPGIVAGSGYADRNNYSGGSSVRLIGPRTTGEESLSSSTSSERDVRTADIKFSWHILDFGLSYIRARQAADKVLIAEETRRRIVVRLMENVRTAYWRAVAATRLEGRLEKLEARVVAALSDSRTLSEKAQSSPLTALTYQRELVEIQRELRRLATELSNAKAQLAALINLDPAKPYQVAVPRNFGAPADPGLSPDALVAIALENRSELREVAYQTRINARDAEAALLEMLPGISLDNVASWSSNRFFFNDHWISWGAQASWNLIKVFSYPDRRAEVEAKDALLDARALAVTMAIMTQVHVARARLYHARQEFETGQRLHNVQTLIVHQIRSAFASGQVSEQVAIREEMNGLVASVKRDISFAEVQSAAAALLASMGMTPEDASPTSSGALARRDKARGATMQTAAR